MPNQRPFAELHLGKPEHLPKNPTQSRSGKCFQQLSAGIRLLPSAKQKQKNLSAAKHRFSSCSKPIGRFILHLDAILATLVWISTTRAGREEAREASATLAALSERDLIMIAMLADVGDEAMCLLRVVDTENYDLTDFPQAVDAYVSHLHTLINEAVHSHKETRLRHSMLPFNYSPSFFPTVP